MTKELSLTKGYVALVDDADFERVARHKWQVLLNDADHLKSPAYAIRKAGTRPNRKNIMLHHFIMDTPKGMFVDHIDLNGLNCQRSNMRICSRAENMCNRRRKHGASGYKGAYPCGKRWAAAIRVEGVLKHLGTFETPQEAHIAYSHYAVNLHGAFARTEE